MSEAREMTLEECLGSLKLAPSHRAIKELEQLREDQKWLQCLENAGVDNWSGYEYAIELAQEE